MRVPDHVLNCVGYVVETIHSDSTGDSFDHQATGFFVALRSSSIPNLTFSYFITAAHVALGLRGKEVDFIVNIKAGTVAKVAAGLVWYTHPDPSVDVAVVPCTHDGALDIQYLSVDDIFLSPNRMRQHKIGIGDEVFLPGSLLWLLG